MDYNDLTYWIAVAHLKGWNVERINRMAVAVLHENEAVNEAVKIRLSKELVTIYVRNGIGLKELMNRFDISRATMQRDIAILKKYSLILFSGAAKTGVYKLTDKLKTKLDSIAGN